MNKFKSSNLSFSSSRFLSIDELKLDNVLWFLDDYKKQYNLNDDKLKNEISGLLKWFKKIFISYLMTLCLTIMFLIIIVTLVTIANLVPTSQINKEATFYIFIIGFIILVLLNVNLFNRLILKKYNNSKIFRYCLERKNVKTKDWFYNIRKIYKSILCLKIKAN